MNRWQEFYDKHRFGTLLALLIALLVSPSLLASTILNSIWHDLILSMMLLIAVASLAAERRQRTYAIVFGVPTIVFMVAGAGLANIVGEWVAAVGHCFAMIYFFGASWLIVTSLFHPKRLTNDRVLGAMCGYLFLGLGWAMAFAIIAAFQPTAFSVSESLQPNQTAAPSTSLLIHFSFVTMTTIGYGDISPISPLARTLSWLEAIFGQFYLAVIVAGLVTMLASGMNFNTDTDGEQ